MPPIYDLTTVRLPRLAGRPFQLFVALLESHALGPLLTRKLLSDLGVPWFRGLRPEEPPAARPLWPAPPPGGAGEPSLRSLPARPGEERRAGFRAPTCEDYLAAYRAGTATPEDVAERALAAIEESDRATPPLRAFIAISRERTLLAARDSTARWKAGAPAGPLDGVPIAVKDELDVAGYSTSVGTRFLGPAPATEDATAVRRLRAAGAVILGKANMHEIGIGVTGLNPHHGTPRNPHAPGRYTGGSSSGPAAAVAAGLCPLALAADAGGSIRIPAALCGVVGLKPTYARVSSRGSAPLAWSLDHYGPIAVSARDAALGYAIVAGEDPLNPATLGQPAPTLEGLEAADPRGVSIGVFAPWLEDAHPGVVATCRELLEGLAARGARLVPVEIPELRAAQVAHLVLVASEMAAAMEAHSGSRRSFGLDVRANLALARAMTARDYLRAQRIRARAMQAVERALADVDVIATPATGVTAPVLRDDALPHGESDLTTLLALMRFAFLANLTGHPSITFPAGYGDGLPVGLQLIGRPWREDVLLRLARAAEALVERRRPRIFHDVLARPGETTAAKR